jgi:hypothetical protein
MSSQSLRKVPDVNASWYPEYIRVYHNIDISVAVQTPGGLMVPIVRDADMLGLGEISAVVKELAAKVTSRYLHVSFDFLQHRNKGGMDFPTCGHNMLGLGDISSTVKGFAAKAQPWPPPASMCCENGKITESHATPICFGLWTPRPCSRSLLSRYAAKGRGAAESGEANKACNHLMPTHVLLPTPFPVTESLEL